MNFSLESEPGGALALPSFEPEQGARILDEIRRRVGETTFTTWFEGLEVHPRRGGRVEVIVPTSFHRTYLSDRYQTLIADATATITGTETPEVDFCVPARSGRTPPFATVTDKPEAGGFEPGAFDVGSPQPNSSETTAKSEDTTSKSREKYAFDGFITGAANRFALAAARAVAERPGEQYNPLFLHGSVGQGKTHLLQAITAAYRARGFKKVISISCAQFADDFIASIAGNRIEEFRVRYRSAEALLIDDIHFLEAKNRTQEEFFHTFNALTNLGRQIVLTSDAAPGEISGLGERLVSRFRKGLVVPLSPPDLVTRIEIIERKGADQGLEIPPDVAELIAKRVRDNVRALEGVVLRLHSLVHLEKRRLDLENTRAVLSELFGDANPRIDLMQIQNAVVHEFDMKVSDLHSRKRTRSIVVPRQIGMYLARRHTGASLGEIGLFFGGRDHTTVLNAVQKIEQVRDQDASLRRRLDTIESALLR